MVFEGYWGHPEATAAAFIELDGKRFFRTGDLGHRDEEGYFFITDRLKRMINASGFKVWPSEVELLLFKCPAVQEACVISAQDAYRGETVKAVVVLRADARGRTTEQDIIDWAREHMAAYKVPRIVSFVDQLAQVGLGQGDVALVAGRGEGPGLIAKAPTMGCHAAPIRHRPHHHLPLPGAGALRRAPRDVPPARQPRPARAGDRPAGQPGVRHPADPGPALELDRAGAAARGGRRADDRLLVHDRTRARARRSSTRCRRRPSSCRWPTACRSTSTSSTTCARTTTTRRACWPTGRAPSCSTTGPTGTRDMLVRMNEFIRASFGYAARDEEGTQTPLQTLELQAPAPAATSRC